MDSDGPDARAAPEDPAPRAALGGSKGFADKIVGFFEGVNKVAVSIGAAAAAVVAVISVLALDTGDADPSRRPERASSNAADAARNKVAYQRDVGDICSRLNRIELVAAERRRSLRHHSKSP